MSSPDYCANHNGLAEIKYSGDYFITYCLSWMLIMFCALPLFTHFKDCILQTIPHILDHFQCIGTFTMHVFNLLLGLYHILKELKQFHLDDNKFQQPVTEQVLMESSPPSDEFIIEVKEQLIVLPSTDEISSLQEIQQQEYCELQVFDMEQLFSYPLQTNIAHSCAPPVVYNDHTFSKFIASEGRCLKFINQDLTFLQPLDIPSTFKNISHNNNSSAQVAESQTQTTSPTIELPTCTCQDQGATPQIQTVEPLLGFTPAEIHRYTDILKLTIEQLLKIESCKEYVQMPIQTLDDIYVHQPRWVLPLVKEAKKLVEALKREQDALQWVGIPPDKLLQESFMEQLNSTQALEQLAPLHAATDYLPKDIINILELLGRQIIYHSINCIV